MIQYAFQRASIALAVLSAVVACSGSKPSAVTTPATAAPYSTVAITRQSVPIERQIDGRIEAVNQGTVSAQTAGRITEINYDVNDFVPAGAVIMRLRATEQRANLQQARAALGEATARQTEADARFKRISEMYESKVVPKATLDEAAANRAAATARLTAARAAVASATEGVAYTEVRAPYAGVVTQRFVEVGESVSPGAPLVSGLSLQFLRVTLDIPQSIVERVRETRQAAVYLNGRRIEATDLTIFPEAASTSASFRARLDLPENAADLYPGMFVKVGLVTGETERILIPASALVERSEVTGVYVFDPVNGGQTRFRQVRTGRLYADSIEVLAGLVAGEQIASEPLVAMRSLLETRDAATGSD